MQTNCQPWKVIHVFYSWKERLQLAAACSPETAIPDCPCLAPAYLHRRMLTPTPDAGLTLRPRPIPTLRLDPILK